jgi:hypothetical protein
MDFDKIVRMVESDRSGPCEDDYEACCPYVDILPEESDGEDASPLNFGRASQTSAGVVFDANYRRWADEQRRVDRQKLRIEHGLCDEMTIRSTRRYK